MVWVDDNINEWVDPIDSDPEEEKQQTLPIPAGPASQDPPKVLDDYGYEITGRLSVTKP